MRPAFYDNPEYKKRQAEITRKYWQAGIFDFKRKLLQTRDCKNPNCQLTFQVKSYDKKVYCGHKCSAQITNCKRTVGLDKNELLNSYSSGLSMTEIAKKCNTSVHKVAYWMDKYKIPRRSLSDAIYLKNHPNGDPFLFKPPSSLEEAKLLGIGLGTYRKKSEYGVIMLYYHNRKLRDLLVGMLPTWLSGRATPW